MILKEVYVITCGCYSDYGIDCIFTDLDKASKYVELRNNDGVEDYRIETYLLNEVSFDQVKIIKINAVKELWKDKYEFKYEIIDVVDDGRGNNRTWIGVNDYSSIKKSNITLHRKFKGDEERIVSKYKKVVEDYFFKIEANWDFYKTYEGRDLLSEAIDKDINSIS